MMEDNYKEINGQMCITTQELIDKLGISRKTLSEWGEKGCPKAQRGWWPLWELLKWRGLIGRGIKTEEDIDDMALQEQKLMFEIKYKKEKAAEAEFENAVSRGDYVEKETIISELQRLFTVLKRSMLGCSRKVAMEVSPFVDVPTTRKIEKMVTELSTDALRQLSIDGVYTATKKKKET